MRLRTLFGMSLWFLLTGAAYAEEKPLFVVDSTYLEEQRLDWQRSLKAGSTIWAITSDKKQVTVTPDNVEAVLQDIVKQYPKPADVIADLKALGRDAVSREQYDRDKPKRPIVSVTVNEEVGAVPGQGADMCFLGRSSCREGTRMRSRNPKQFCVLSGRSHSKILAERWSGSITVLGRTSFVRN